MKRRLFQLAGLIAVGVIVNIAVAWSWAAWGVVPNAELGNWSISHEDSPQWTMREQAAPGAAIVIVRPLFLGPDEFNPWLRLGQSRPDVNQRVLDQFRERPTEDERHIRYSFDERGWPFRSLRSEHSYARGPDNEQRITDVKVSGGIQLWPEQTKRGGWGMQRIRALPLIPIWPAFIANSLLYALIAAAFLLGYPAMIRAQGKQRIKRRAIIAAILAPFMVLAVAWSAALMDEPASSTGFSGVEQRMDRGDDEPQYLTAKRHDRLGGTRLTFDAPFRHGQDVDGLRPPPIEGILPRWARRDLEIARQREWRLFSWYTVEATGWPARAMRSSFYTGVVEETVAVEITDVRGVLYDDLPVGLDLSAPTELRVLPMRILWIGAILNWLLYAIVLFGLLAFPGGLRRGVRARRGRCVECGYDLRGEYDRGCSECGWGRPYQQALRASNRRRP